MAYGEISLNIRRRAHEWRERRLLQELGIPDFETIAECERRQSAMMRRLARFGHEAANQNACSAEGCKKVCSAACHFASRAARVQIIPQACELLKTGDQLYQANIVPPQWELPPGDLRQANIAAAFQWTARRLRTADARFGIGSYEVSFNERQDGTRMWAPEMVLIIAGVDKTALKSAFSIENDPERKHAKPVRFTEVANLGRQLGYATKRFFERRIEYYDKTGRRNQNHKPLRPREEAELDSWLSSLDAQARYFFFGCRLHSGHLRHSSGGDNTKYG